MYIFSHRWTPLCIKCCFLVLSGPQRRLWVKDLKARNFLGRWFHATLGGKGLTQREKEASKGLLSGQLWVWSLGSQSPWGELGTKQCLVYPFSIHCWLRVTSGSIKLSGKSRLSHMERGAFPRSGVTQRWTGFHGIISYRGCRWNLGWVC